MSIASEITRLQGVKSDILQAISDKGVTVPVGSALDDCPDLIEAISGGGIVQNFVNKSIFGDTYKCVEIDNGVFFPVENLKFKDENIDLITDASQIVYASNQCFYYNCDNQYSYNGFLYTTSAATYIINNILPNYSSVRMLQATDLTKIMEYISDCLLQLEISNLGDLVKTFSIKHNIPWTNALQLVDLGIKPTGYHSGSFGGIDRYCGFGSSNESFIDIQNDNAAIRFVTSASWGSNCYCMRFIVDEN